MRGPFRINVRSNNQSAVHFVVDLLFIDRYCVLISEGIIKLQPHHVQIQCKGVITAFKQMSLNGLT